MRVAPFSIRRRFVLSLAHSYAYGNGAEYPYATALLTTFDFSLNRPKAVKSLQTTIASQIKVGTEHPCRPPAARAKARPHSTGPKSSRFGHT